MRILYFMLTNLFSLIIDTSYIGSQQFILKEINQYEEKYYG